jgi:hypothetical protein
MNIEAYVAIVIPMKPDLHPVIRARQFECLSEMVEDMHSNRFYTSLYIDSLPHATPYVHTHAERQKACSALRNTMIENLQRMTPRPTHVLWIDADVIRYPNELGSTLVKLSIAEKAITAPAVFLDDSSGKCPPYRWYDTAGFIHERRRAEETHPWFRTNPKPLPHNPFVLQLNGSVGCVYCVPWEVYQTGARYEFAGTTFTEHMPICQAALSMGMKVLIDTRLHTYHAYLPDFGERFH